MPGADEGGHSPTDLRELLAEARALGFLGPGPLDPQVRHAQGFAAIARRLSGRGPVRLVDLGSGGGLPGLVVATEWPEAAVALLEANGRRAAFLRRAVERLDLEGRVSVLEERAEVCGREPGLRAGFDGVLARSFGRPAVLAECAAPLLRVGGWLLVSEPPRTDPEDVSAPGGRRSRCASWAWSRRRWSTRVSSTAPCASANRAPTASPGATGSRPRSPCSEALRSGPVRSGGGGNCGETALADPVADRSDALLPLPVGSGTPQSGRLRSQGHPAGCREAPSRAPRYPSSRRGLPRGASVAWADTHPGTVTRRCSTWNDEVKRAEAVQARFHVEQPQVLTSGLWQARIGAVRRRFGSPT